MNYAKRVQVLYGLRQLKDYLFASLLWQFIVSEFKVFEEVVSVDTLQD